ncbi:DMT family transporter [Demequina sp. NBRC 110057]|uniref:DMT family transporter n=1 Tax=Demequina sp. NBRC 110057 TaxID=1570346 RepID=UPI0009FD45F5|nr:DMT family transporter [Demequina sp. NBRC 110057]
MKIDRARLAGLCVVVLWASAFPAIHVAVLDLGVIGLSFVRLAVATAALLTVGALVGLRMPRREDVPWIAAAGFFGMFAYQLLLNASEIFVPAGTASIIVSAAPLVSVATAWVLFREPVTRRTVVGSAIAFGGVALVCLARAHVSLSASVAIVLAAMIVQGIYHPLQRPLTRHYTGLEVATYAMVAGTLFTIPLVPFGWPQMVSASGGAWAAGIYLGLLPSALGFVLWAYAVGRMPVAASTSLLYLVPPVAVFITWAWIGDVPLVAEIAGGLIIVAGVMVISQRKRVRQSIDSGKNHRANLRSTAPGVEMRAPGGPHA